MNRCDKIFNAEKEVQWTSASDKVLYNTTKCTSDRLRMTDEQMCNITKSLIEKSMSKCHINM